VVGAAGVTKLALYHHYSGKQALFRSVYDQERRHVAEAVRDAYLREADPWKGLYAGFRAFLEVSLDPEVQRITLRDAPAALGWDLMREIEEDYSMSPLERGLEIAITSGRIEPRPVRPLAHLLFGAICEGAMMAARFDAARNRGRPSRALPHARRHDARLEAVIASRRARDRNRREEKRAVQPPLPAAAASVCEVSSAS
jgi:AcrR family transcriptional regulator